MKKIVLMLIALLSFNVFATTPQEAYKMAKEGKAVIVDVREQDEIKDGMVDIAAWFPMSKINTDESWKQDFAKLTKGKKIFLYCRSGNRSGKVQNILKENGIESENIGGYMTLKDELPSKKP